MNHNPDRTASAPGLRSRASNGEDQEPRAAVEDSGGRVFVAAVTSVAGLLTLAAGVWALASPSSFAEAVAFPNAEHFLHDLGAFQIGIGASLLLALGWRDGLALALAGFLVGNSIHAVNHAVDLDLGGHAADPWGLGLVSVLVAAALLVPSTVVLLGRWNWWPSSLSRRTSPPRVPPRTGPRTPAPSQRASRRQR